MRAALHTRRHIVALRRIARAHCAFFARRRHDADDVLYFIADTIFR